MFDFGKGDKPSPFDFAPRKKKDRTALYRLWDNIAGIDDGVNTPGERLGKGVNDLAKGLANDPAGMAGKAVQGIKGDLDNLMFEGGAMERPQDVLGYAAAPMAPGVMSGRVANVMSAGGAKPSQDVLDLLKAGRGSEVTDEMMAAADPQFLYNNYDLPMDEASRMQRAGEMGFDTGTPLYHGTGQDFQSFNPSFRGGVADAYSARRADWFADSPTTAQGYADMAGKDAPVARLIKQSEAAERNGKWDEAHELMAQAERLEANMPDSAGQTMLPVVSKQPQTMIDANGGGVNDLEMPMRDALADAKKSGDVGVEFRNFSDHPDYSVEDPALHRGIFKANDVRSKFARFDPRLKHLSNLSAAGAGAAYLGGQGGEQDQMAQIREYLARAKQ